MDPCSSTSRPHLKNKKMREIIPIPNIEISSIQPNFKTKPKRKRIIGSVSLFKTESELETNINKVRILIFYQSTMSL